MGRGFSWMALALLALWIVAALGVATAFFKSPRDPLRAADWQLDAGVADSFEIGQPRLVRGGPLPVWVARVGDQSFTALDAVCSHQHCMLRWEPARERLVCPCHQGSYELDGLPVTGPDRPPLRSFHVSIRSHRVRVHLQRPAGDQT